MSPPLEAAAARLSLMVSTSDSQSEIIVLDARGRLVQRGFGPQHTFELEPGIYRVKVLTGTEFQEKSVVLTDTRRDPWAACTIDVTPGVYELRLELPGGETLRQSFVASPNWQTQSFLFMRAYPSDTGPQWRADLSRTSVLLSATRGFSPNEAMLRTAELARVTLATKGPGERGQTNRRLMPDEMRM